MFPQERFRLTRQAALLALISAAFPAAGLAAPAGRVDFAVGEVTATGADGRARALAKGSEVGQGDTIVTGASGRAQIRFSDGAYSSLQPQTTFRIDDYQYAGQADGSEKGFFSLVKGALRTITGAIGRVNRNTYKVNTPTATIGIRGTEYLAREVSSLDVTVGEGLIEVCNAAGCIIIAEGESAYVKDPNTQPTLTYRKTELPAPPPGTFYVFEKGDEGFVAQLPVLPSGGGYAFAGAGLVLSQPVLSDSTSNSLVAAAAVFPWVVDPIPSGTATFSGTDLLAYAPDSVRSVTAAFSGVPVGGLTDGVIGWGRWSSASVTGCEGSFCTSTPLQDFHYVVGRPTPAADMQSLAGMVGTYSLLGFTFPTAQNGTVGTEPVTGSLTANFGGSGSVAYDLDVPIGGHVFDVNGSAAISGSTFSGFQGSVTSATGCAGGCSAPKSAGAFVGPGAERAGMVYQFTQFSQTAGPGTDLGAVSGAVTFTRTGLGSAPLQ